MKNICGVDDMTSKFAQVTISSSSGSLFPFLLTPRRPCTSSDHCLVITQHKGRSSQQSVLGSGNYQLRMMRNLQSGKPLYRQKTRSLLPCCANRIRLMLSVNKKQQPHPQRIKTTKREKRKTKEKNKEGSISIM